ncbi:MAG: helix-turn-helix transcriptional regulator [Clostridia bacterium]|jgi:DNA-binding XRE family transcriptional regulator|nr:helix-turn-helix transcriptional regulator [Clostridia bacterium]
MEYNKAIRTMMDNVFMDIRIGKKDVNKQYKQRLIIGAVRSIAIAETLGEDMYFESKKIQEYQGSLNDDGRLVDLNVEIEENLDEILVEIHKKILKLKREIKTKFNVEVPFEICDLKPSGLKFRDENIEHLFVDQMEYFERIGLKTSNIKMLFDNIYSERITNLLGFDTKELLEDKVELIEKRGISLDELKKALDSNDMDDKRALMNKIQVFNENLLDMDLKKLRIEKGFSQKEIAKIVGLNLGNYGSIERGNAVNYSRAGEIKKREHIIDAINNMPSNSSKLVKSKLLDNMNLFDLDGRVIQIDKVEELNSYLTENFTKLKEYEAAKARDELLDLNYISNKESKLQESIIRKLSDLVENSIFSKRPVNDNYYESKGFDGKSLEKLQEELSEIKEKKEMLLSGNAREEAEEIELETEIYKNKNYGIELKLIDKANKKIVENYYKTALNSNTLKTELLFNKSMAYAKKRINNYFEKCKRRTYAEYIGEGKDLDKKSNMELKSLLLGTGDFLAGQLSNKSEKGKKILSNHILKGLRPMWGMDLTNAIEHLEAIEGSKLQTRVLEAIDPSVAESVLSKIEEKAAIELTDTEIIQIITDRYSKKVIVNDNEYTSESEKRCHINSSFEKGLNQNNITQIVEFENISFEEQDCNRINEQNIIMNEYPEITGIEEKSII